MSEFLDRVEAGVRQRRLLPAGGKILVAVSGGVDSMVLLQVLHQLAEKNRWKISVAHFNHQLRGKASDADERLVCATAKKLSLPVFCERGDVAGFARRAKVSIEMAARKLRHEFLTRIARKQKIPVIALAHHADDQVELFFLRLLRGTGGGGLSGMKWSSPSPADSNIRLVRPLLDCGKSELLDFARQQKIRFSEDATNFSTDFLRNRIRNELLPLLRKKYQPGLDKVVLRLMDIVGAEAELVSEMAQTVGSSLRLDSVRPQAERYNGLSIAIQRKMLQQQLTGLGLSPDFELVEQLRENPGRFVSVGSGLSVKRDATGKVSLREQLPSEFNGAELNIKLTGRVGQMEFYGREFKWQLKSSGGLRLRGDAAASAAQAWGRSSRLTEFFDADKVGGQVTLRHWRPGDRFQPIGMKSAVKLQDLFVNSKIPAARRRTLILAVAASGEIFWVEGLRIGENFKLTPRTTRQLAWKHSKIEA